jgi:hypothetical protein
MEGNGMPTRWLFASVLALGALPVAPAAAFPQLANPLNTGDALSFLTGSSIDALSGSLRGYLVHNLSPTLYEASPGWGQTKRVARGVKWKGKVLPLRPELMYGDKNDGTWKKIRVTADNLADTLIFDLRNVHMIEPGRVGFDVFLSLDVHVDYQQQKWDAGIRLSDTSTRARLRVKLTLGCEVSGRLEPTGALLPDAVIQLRVVRSDLRYDNLVVEHVAGVGGEAAKLIGDTVKGGLREWYPSLERELLAKANAAIVKAGENKEVRVSLSRLLTKKLHVP